MIKVKVFVYGRRRRRRQRRRRRRRRGYDNSSPDFRHGELKMGISTELSIKTCDEPPNISALISLSFQESRQGGSILQTKQGITNSKLNPS